MANHSMDEHDAVSALTGMSLDHILQGMGAAGSSITNRLGMAGISALDSNQIYGDKYDEEAVGVDTGEDWEAQVDKELQDEGDDGYVQPVQKMKKRRTRVVRRMVERPKSVYERFPAFRKNEILDFSELFQGYTARKSRLVKRPFHIETVYPRKKEPPKAYLDSIVGDTQRQVENKQAEDIVAAGSVEQDLRKALEERNKSDVPVTLPLNDRAFDLILLSDWEDQIRTDPWSIFNVARSENSLTTPINKVLESGAWTQSIIWTPGAPFRDFTQIEFNHEDDIIPEEKPTDVVRPRKRMRLDGHQVKDKFNLSNDHLYEVAKDKLRVRQTFGQLIVEHARPATKLQLPFYKTRLAKQEARAFHRPALQFPLNIEFKFSKVRKAKKKDKNGKKVAKGGNPSERLQKTADLTLKDSANFVLLEYSEEHPPIISNYGMGSILVNYYRKRDEKDDNIKKLDLGVPFFLEPPDESPFMKFGSVEPGQTIPVLYNNLIRAPLFRHKPYSTDFLVIRHTVGNKDVQYYIREIKNLFVIGQTYPVKEVPGPHSRKITNTIKFRLQNIACKLLQKSPEERLKISRLMKYFPDQNELQMRQRLKEFMEYHRRGPHQGFWRLRPDWPVPTDAEMEKNVGPEEVVQMESMQVGQRFLQDAGYGETAESAEGHEAHLSVEQKLAPWITTKNFLQATQSKAMLRLHGEGDPTGRGEAFSFIRISMKDIFVREGEDYDQKVAEAENRPKSAHRYNVAEQQQIYKSEIDRIWKAQFNSLSRTDEPQLTEDEKEEEKKAAQAPSPLVTSSFPNFAKTTFPYAASFMSPQPAAAPSPAFSRGSSADPDREMSLGPDGNARRVLRIKRLVDGQWETEIIRDQAVIRAYIKSKEMAEEEMTEADSLAPTGDADKDARARKRLEEQIARMKKNQERRLHRKNAKIVKEGGTPLSLDRPMKQDTTRRCGHCGQIGHMKTNRKCPRWAEFNSGTMPPPVTPGPSTPVVPPILPSASSNFNNRSTPTATTPAYGFPAVSSPLATSPPMMALPYSPVSGGGEASRSTPGPAEASKPKIKLTLKPKAS